MEVRIQIDPGCEGVSVTITAGALTDEVKALARRLEEAYLDSWVGEVLPVLFEEEKEGLWQGHAPNYARVAAASGEDLHNRVVMTRITGVEGDLLIGELIS